MDKCHLECLHLLKLPLKCDPNRVSSIINDNNGNMRAVGNKVSNVNKDKLVKTVNKAFWSSWSTWLFWQYSSTVYMVSSTDMDWQLQNQHKLN